MLRISRIPDVTTVALFVAVFLFSLGSFYFYQFGMYLFQVIGVALSICLFQFRFVRWKSPGCIFLLTFFLYIYVYSACAAAASGSENFGIAKLTLPIFVFGYFAFAVVCFSIYLEKFFRVLRWVILLHVAAFLVQFSFFIFTGQVIDFLQPVTGETQRVIGGSYSLSYLPVFARMSGMYNEPGTYSTWIIILLLLFKMIERRLGLEPKNFWLELMVIATVLLSFSTYGVMFVVLYMGAALVEKGLRPKTLAAMGIGGALFAYLGYEYFSQRFSVGGTDAGVGLRGQAVDAYFHMLNTTKLTFGLGLFTDAFVRFDNELVAQDVGFWFSLATGTGLVGLLLFGAFLVFALPRTIHGFCLLIVLLLCKFTLTNALVWVVLFSFVVLKVESDTRWQALSAHRVKRPNRITS